MPSFSDYLKKSSKWTAASAESTTAEAVSISRHLLPIEPYFYVNRLHHSLPPETKRWVRSAADERAAIEHGCRFSELRGMQAVNWIERNCKLYEGFSAGEYILLGDWQFEQTMQIFGWLFFDEEWEQRKAGLGWVRRYREVGGWIPKKNAKSPTLAAHGLYLCMGDGEMGQKCFSLATVREQANISHQHAVNFVRQSPELITHCKIDATTSDIFDLDTLSKYVILCGEKGGVRNTKEGINGSLFVDETHVVNAELMHIVERAGISRRQPLKEQLSTTGSNTAGYGHDLFEKGQMNLKAAEEGRKFNYRFLHFEYAIPQSTSVEELRDEPTVEKFIRLANPTLGRILSYNEAKSDWLNSLSSDTELLRYAMYRLNLWVTGGSEFVALSDWNRCISSMSLEELSEYPCIVGVDPSSKRDMTSACLIFAVPRIIRIPTDPFDLSAPFEEREINVPHCMSFFWVPRRSVSQYSGKIDIEKMAERRQLYITQSQIVRAEIIAEFIASLDERFDLRGVATDSYYSTDLAACLVSQHGWDADRITLVKQTSAALGPAFEQLQGCILSQEIAHFDHPLLAWQLGNISVEEDTNNNRRFTRPQRADYRKIDGWSAILTGIWLMMTDPDLYPGATLSISLARQVTNAPPKSTSA